MQRVITPNDLSRASCFTWRFFNNTEGSIKIAWLYWTEHLQRQRETRKQKNLQANSRSACQFWHKREKEALFAKLHIPSLPQGIAYVLRLFLPQGFEIKLIFALRSTIFETRANFQNFHIWARNLEFEERSQKLHMYSLSTPGGSKLSLFLLYGQPFSRYGLMFKISIFGHVIWNFKKAPKVE